MMPCDWNASNKHPSPQHRRMYSNHQVKLQLSLQCKWCRSLVVLNSLDAVTPMAKCPLVMLHAWNIKSMQVSFCTWKMVRICFKATWIVESSSRNWNKSFHQALFHSMHAELFHSKKYQCIMHIVHHCETACCCSDIASGVVVDGTLLGFGVLSSCRPWNLYDVWYKNLWSWSCPCLKEVEGSWCPRISYSKDAPSTLSRHHWDKKGSMTVTG
jgi:hypothetical protein